MARKTDAAIDELDTLVEVDDDVTLRMRADETERLIEAAFRDVPPSSRRLPTRTLAPLVLADTAGPPSPWRPRVTPALAQAARELLLAEDARRRNVLIRTRKTELWLVAGIWAMALSLVVIFAWIVTTA